MSALLRKSVTDLTRRKARALFSILTLALAVASVSTFAVPELIDRSMQSEVRAERLAHVTVSTRPLPLSDVQLASLAALPNVEAVEARSGVQTRLYVGERRAPALVIGVRDFARQAVDVVRVTSGVAPARGEVLVDVQNANQGMYDGRTGDVARVVGPSGAERQLRIIGEATNLGGGRLVADGRRRRPLRDRGDGRRAERRAGVRRARLPTPGHECGREHARGGAGVAREHVRLHRLLRPARDPGAR
jgi:hypothetical protein